MCAGGHRKQSEHGLLRVPDAPVASCRRQHSTDDARRKQCYGEGSIDRKGALVTYLCERPVYDAATGVPRSASRQKCSWSRVSAVSSGWKAVARRAPSLTAMMLPSLSVASTVT